MRNEPQVAASSRHRRDHRLLDVGKRGERILDHLRIDHLAVDLDAQVDAPQMFEGAVGEQAAAIARAHASSSGQDRQKPVLALVWLLPVANRDIVSANDDLAGLANRHGAPPLVHDLDRLPGEHTTKRDCAWGEWLTGLDRRAGDVAGLGRAVHIHDRRLCENSSPDLELLSATGFSSDHCEPNAGHPSAFLLETGRKTSEAPRERSSAR